MTNGKSGKSQTNRVSDGWTYRQLHSAKHVDSHICLSNKRVHSCKFKFVQRANFKYLKFTSWTKCGEIPVLFSIINNPWIQALAIEPVLPTKSRQLGGIFFHAKCWLYQRGFSLWVYGCRLAEPPNTIERAIVVWKLQLLFVHFITV